MMNILEQMDLIDKLAKLAEKARDFHKNKRNFDKGGILSQEGTLTLNRIISEAHKYELLKDTPIILVGFIERYKADFILKILQEEIEDKINSIYNEIAKSFLKSPVQIAKTIPPDKRGRILEIIGRDWLINVVNEQWGEAKYKQIKGTDIDAIAIIKENESYKIYIAEIKSKLDKRKAIKEFINLNNKCQKLRSIYPNSQICEKIMIIFSKVDEDIKQTAKTKFGIVIWDIEVFKEISIKQGKKGGKFYLDAVMALNVKA